MLAVVAPSPVTVAVAIPVVLIVLWTAQHLRIEYRLSKNPGVRAPALANNPFSGVSAILRLAASPVSLLLCLVLLLGVAPRASARADTHM